MAFRAPFSFAGVPVARLSAAPCPLFASSDEEAPVSSHHEVGTGGASLIPPRGGHRRRQSHPTTRWEQEAPVSSHHEVGTGGASLIPPRGGNRPLLREARVKAPLCHGAPHSSARVVVGRLVHLYTRQV